MLVFGSRLLMAAAFVWFYEAAICLYIGAWPNVAWADVLSVVWGRHGVENLASNLRIPMELFMSPLGTSCFVLGLPIFLVGLVGFEMPGKRTPA